MRGILIFLGIIVSIDLHATERTPSGTYMIPAHTRPAILEVHSKAGRCTAALIGPRVFVTAAHCFKSEITGYTLYKKSKILFKAYITPEYDPMPPEEKHLKKYQPKDVAFGILERPILNVTPYTILWETPPAKKVISYGFGCSGNKLAIYYLTEVSNLVYEKEYRGNLSQIVALCPGDSGGPAFSYFNDRLYLVGVNRATNVADSSWITVLARSYVYDLLMKVQSEHKHAKICGINMECELPTL